LLILPEKKTYANKCEANLIISENVGELFIPKTQASQVFA